MKKFSPLLIVALLLSIMLVTAASAQKKHLTVEDYDQWQSLRGGTFSKTGAWFAYSVNLVDGDGWLALQNLTTGKEDTFKVSTNPQFSADENWFAFRIGYPEDEEEKMKKAKKPVRFKMGLMELATAEIDTLEGVAAFNFNETGRYLVMKKYKAKGVKSGGSDIILRDLKGGTDQIFGNVADYKFNEEGDLLALTIDADEMFGNGVHVVRLDAKAVEVLDSHKAKYRNLVWNDDGNALAFLREVEDDDYDDPNHKLFAFTDLTEKNIEKSKYKRFQYDPADDENFTEGYRIVHDRRLEWSEDTGSLFFGVKEWKKSEKAVKKAKKEAESEQKPGEIKQNPDETGQKVDKKDEESDKKPDEKEEKKKDKDKDLPPPGVDVWHWKDDPVQPQQAKRQGQLKSFNYLAAFHLKEQKFVQLTSGDFREFYLTGDQKHVMAYNKKPYQPVFEDSWRDVYVIDVMTGEETLVMERTLTMRPSPFGKYLAYFKDNEWWTYEIVTGTHTNVTGNIDARFENDTSVTGRAVYNPWGSSRWMEDDKAMHLFTQYDVYRVTPDGKKFEKLTNGTDEQIRFRIRIMDYENDYFEKDETLYLTAYGDWTKDSGFYRLNKGKNLEKLLYEGTMTGRLLKAEDADVFAFTKEKADDSPDIFITDKSFTNVKQITNLNPQQEEYYWGGSELIDFTNANGVKLQGRLLYPENYVPGEKYPMMVYIYEKRSQSLHSYTMPTRERAYGQRRFSAEGFFVFEPDIVYRINDPGFSAVECVVPAVEKVIETGMIDAEKIGLMGHSWGAYQTAFIITQTDLFSAAVAGAPLINMVSMSLSVYWNTGTPNLNIFETSQGRLEEPFWELKEKYWDNSPLYQSNNIRTPLLVAFGDNDGAVDWNQGVEMYNAMRRQGKPYVMLVYAGENHGLRKKENMIDYANRTHDWIRHYLLGEEPAKWIVEGVPLLEKPTKKNK